MPLYAVFYIVFQNAELQKILNRTGRQETLNTPRTQPPSRMFEVSSDLESKTETEAAAGRENIRNSF